MEKGAVIKHDLKKAPKTGEWRYMAPEVDKQKCIGCSTCVPFCPEASITVERKSHNANRESQATKNTDSGSTIRDMGCAVIDFEYCKGCGVCAAVCPVKAILMKKGK